MEIGDEFGFLFLSKDLLMSLFLVQRREIEPAFELICVIKYFR
jgi:hypothetical protein